MLTSHPNASPPPLSLSLTVKGVDFEKCQIWKTWQRKEKGRVRDKGGEREREREEEGDGGGGGSGLPQSEIHHSA